MSGTRERARPLAPGSCIGDLTIEQMLGEGGFGAVYRALDREGRPCAVKVSNVAVERLRAPQLAWQQNEVEALARLRHPSLVNVMGHGTTAEGHFYLVLELAEGIRLDQYIRDRKRVDSLEAVQIGRRIAESLAYCHARGVFHRDLSPHNIIITNPSTAAIKILDFGLAQVSEASELEQPALGVGTIGYAPPERFVDRGKARGAVPSAKQDLYALGAILYTMLTGHRVFESRSRDDEVWQLITMNAPSVRAIAPAVPEPLATLISSLLEPNPARRFASAAALTTELKSLYYQMLRGESGSVARGRGPTQRISDEAAFTGRTRELDELADAVDGVARKRGRAILVTGDAGIGKSRLVSEMLVSCVAEDTVVAHGRARNVGESLPYAALREVLGQLATSLLERSPHPSPTVRDVLATEGMVLGALAPELAELVPEGDADLSSFRLAGTDRVARAIRRLLAAVAADKMVVITVEDLHWADIGTVALLRKLLEEPPPPGVLLVMTARAGMELESCAGLSMLRLQPLSPAHTDALLLDLTGGADRATLDALKDAIPLLAAGNPLINTRVIRDLEQLGHLRYDGDGPHIDLAALQAHYTPPDSVSSMLERELVELSPDTLLILGTAALLGRQFRITELRELGLYETSDVHAAVNLAEQLRLCRANGDTCTFVHDTIRDYLIKTIPTDRVRDVHAAIARALDLRGATPAERAHHLEYAGDVAAASAAYFAAGLDADRLHDPHGAARHLTRAFDLMVELPPAQRDPHQLGRQIHELVRVDSAFGKPDDMLAVIERARAAVPDPSPDLAAAIHSSYARVYYVQGQMLKAAEHSAMALSTPDLDLRARSYHCLPANVVGRGHCVSGRFGSATELLSRGCRLAAEAGEYGELSHSAGLLSVAFGFTGQYALGEHWIEECAQLAARLHDPIRIAASHVYRSALAEARYDWQLGVSSTSELLAFADDQRIGGLYLYVGTAMAGRHQFHVGQLERARILLRNALAMSEELSIVMLRAWTHAYLGDVHFVLDRADEAEAQYRAGLDAANTRNDSYAGPLCLIGLAHVAALRGDSPVRVKSLASDALARLTQASNVSTRATVLHRYERVLAALGEPREAIDAVEQERAEVLGRLGIHDVAIWPTSRPAPPASDASETLAALQPTADAPISGAAPIGRLGSEATAPRRGLMDELSTLEGFIPAFLR